MDLLTAFSRQAQESGLLEAELAFILILSLAAVVAIVSRRIRLPYTVALVIVGLGLSFVSIPYRIDLSSELILSLLVPPLIFEATLNLQWETLRKYLAPILLLALVGTFLGTFIVGMIILVAGRTLVPELSFAVPAAFAFGALISATDPVAVIALFRDLGVSKRLAVLIEGESLFNDAVAIVLFDLAIIAGVALTQGDAESFTIGTAIAEFLQVFFGGLVVGGLLGYLVSTVVLKNVDDHLIETATTVALAFGSFIVAEQFHVSGVLAVVAAGIFVGNIGMKNTSPTTKITVTNFWEFLAFVVNSMVFLLIGLEADLTQIQPNLSLVMVAIIAVLLSRAIVVYGLTEIHGYIDPQRRLPISYRHVQYWGGLRGAISLALALSLSGSLFSDEVETELRLMTFGVVLFTLLIQGTTIGPLLQRLGLTAIPEQKREQQRKQALVYAKRAGRQELDRLHNNGILSEQVYRAIAEVYTNDLRHLNSQLRDLLHDYPELEQAMVLQTRKDLIQAERTALGDAIRRGLISEEVYSELVVEMDHRIEALELIVSAMQESESQE